MKPGNMSFLAASTLLLLLLQVLSAEGTFPEYKRGKDYQWILSRTDRDNGISYMGSHGRLRAALGRLQKGETLKMATIGGSITAGQGCVDAPNWPTYLFNYMQDMYGDKVVGHNGAVAGTISGYMSVCHNMHVPKDVDIVFVEYSVNDWHSIQPYYENSLRRSFERLLRKLFKYPKSPAVVFMHAYCWFQSYPHPGAFWSNTEREFSEYALYYNMPSLSVKSACYQKMVADVPGFSIKAPRNTNEVGLKEVAFYYDPIHPDGRTGARVMGELAMHLLTKVYDEVAAHPVTDEDTSWVLPAPLVAQNYESISDKCFIGQHFTSTVQVKEGWEWINESKTPRPKWGFVATTVGAVIKMLIDTSATAGGAAAAPAGAARSLSQLPEYATKHYRMAAGPARATLGKFHTISSSSAAQGTAAASGAEVLVELAYLRSYEHMGRSRVTCEGDCSCEPSVMEGHHAERNTQLFLHDFYVTQGAKCVVVVTVLEESSSGEHKCKLAGIMISEESGQHEGIRNHAAVEYVGDISQRSKDGTFDASNHAR